VGRPAIADRQAFLSRLEEVLDSRWLTNDGPLVRELEQRICHLLGVGHCVATCNGTVALEILARALDLSGEVIVPSFTFIATAHALRWLGITPVFCDIDPHTHNLDPTRLPELITDRTSAILAVHLWGRPCATGQLQAVAAQHRLPLLYDAAHAFYSSHNGTMIGGFGTAEVFSFHATKFMHSFEGGAVVTNDDALAARLRLLRNFGFAGIDKVVDLGINGKLSEVAAAMGLANIERIDDLISRNQEHYRLYRHELAGIAGLSLIEYDEQERCNYQYLVLAVDESKAGLSRDQLVAVLEAENIRARRYFYPGCHRMEPYRSEPQRAELIHTERLSEMLIVLPTGAAVDSDDIRLICRVIRRALAGSGQVRRVLQDRSRNGG
jgi:dTDP-4-amino-4,6-dideoxygalactose transaminase